MLAQTVSDLLVVAGWTGIIFAIFTAILFAIEIVKKFKNWSEE